MEEGALPIKLSIGQVMYFKEVCAILSIPASSPLRGFVNHRWLSTYDASMATYTMLPAYKVLYFGYLSTEDQELYKEPLEVLYREYSVSQTAKARIRLLHEDLSRKGDDDHWSYLYFSHVHYSRQLLASVDYYIIY